MMIPVSYFRLYPIICSNILLFFVFYDFNFVLALYCRPYIIARAENAVLAAKVKELSFKVAELELQNQTLLAEVEMYRAEAGGARPPNTAGTIGADGGDDDETTAEEYIVSGNGVRLT
jgi:hypothetical protein